MKKTIIYASLILVGLMVYLLLDDTCYKFYSEKDMNNSPGMIKYIDFRTNTLCYNCDVKDGIIQILDTNSNVIEVAFKGTFRYPILVIELSDSLKKKVGLKTDQLIGYRKGDGSMGGILINRQYLRGGEDIFDERN